MLENEGLIRLACFVAVFVVMALWEIGAPRRPLTTSKPRRWVVNLGITLLNTIVVRLLFSAAAVGAAYSAQKNGWGLLNAWMIPTWIAFIVAIVSLDFVIYLQHVMFHAIPSLWRLHMVHHADLDFDVTTGARFHPVEIVLSMLIKFAAIFVLGAPPVGVLVFEILLNGTAMFNHSNVRMPEAIDRVLRLFVVTPDMHRVHHSIIRNETNSNYGFNLPWWDRLMGTYTPQPSKGHTGMTIGLEQFREPARLTLAAILALPFIGEIGRYPINRGGSKE